MQFRVCPKSETFFQIKMTDPMVVQSRMRGLYGASGTLNIKFQVQFLTANRMRIDIVNEGRQDRVPMLSRVEDAANTG